MPGMPELKQAMVELVAVAEKYDLGMGVTLSNQDSGRYLFRLPSWCIVRATSDGDIAAQINLKNGDKVVGEYGIDIDVDDEGAEERIRASVHSMQSSVDNMRSYADTVEGILDGMLKLLEKRGVAVFIEGRHDLDEDLAKSLHTPNDKLN